MNSLARALCTWMVAAWAVLVSPGLHAQPTVELAPSDALACLTPNAAQRGAIEFPFDAWKTGRDGEVKVRAMFDSADGAPELRVLTSEGGAEFEAAVKAAMKQWRVPCLRPGQRATLEQVVAFKSSLGKAYTLPARDAAEALELAALRCMAHLRGEKTPDYPSDALRQGVQGNVLARVRVTGPDREPEVVVSARPQARSLARSVREWLKDVRMPCLSGEHINSIYTFKFVFEGDNFGLKPMTLTQFLPGVKGIRSTPLQLDTTAMGCPFSLRWQFRRPFADNGVHDLDTTPRPEREPLFAWLRQVELNLSEEALDAVYGDNTILTVPCLKINLNPKEKT
jgi:hypothetical protein